MTGLGEPVTVPTAAAASARLVSRGEGVAPSTRKPTTLTGGDLESGCFFCIAAAAPAAHVAASWPRPRGLVCDRALGAGGQGERERQRQSGGGSQAAAA